MVPPQKDREKRMQRCVVIEPLEGRRLLSATLSVERTAWLNSTVGQATLLAAAPKAPSVTITKIGTTGLKISWPAPTASEAVAISKYRITYTPGMWAPGSIGQKKTIDVARTATSVTLTGLLPFTLYSIDITAMSASGNATTHKNWWTAAPATQKRFLYLFDLPKNRKGFTNLKRQIEVFDVNAGHKWVRNIPLPSGIYNVRGVAASAATKKLYVAFFNGPNDGYQPGGLLCIDLATDKLLWLKRYDKAVVPSPDRFDITPDGSKIYMPVGEHGTNNFWVVLDAKTGNPITRITHVTAPHNTIVSVDGKRAFLEGQEKGTQPAAYKHTVAVVDTATNKVIKRVGPFRDVVRPFTINGKGSLIFATVNNFVGFQVADVAIGKVIYTAAPTNYVQPDPPLGRSLSHGIAMTPDEKTIWVVDGLKIGVHVWDISKTPASPPKYLGFVKTRAQGKSLTGVKDPNASNDTDGVPAWVVPSYDGKYMYPESGEIIEVATRKVVGQLRSKTINSTGALVDAPYSHSRFILEVNFDGGKLVRVTDQFGIGRVR
jgi:DNA-binding beta-propeller fold protein YncE